MALLGAITNAGRTLIREWLKGDTSGGLTHFGVGTTSTTPATSDTALTSEVFTFPGSTRIRAEGSAYEDRIARFDGYVNCLGNVGDAIAECGIFTSATSGTMFLHDVPASIAPKGNKQIIRYRIKVEVK